MKIILGSVLLFTLLVGALSHPPTSSDRLIRVDEIVPPKWLTQEEVDILIKYDINFMDITDHQSPPVKSDKIFAYPTTLKYRAIVQQIFPKLSIPRMEAFLTELASYHNRYYTTETGAKSADWIQAQAAEAVISSGYTGQVEVKAFTHSWVQNSVIARIEGSDPTLKTEVIVLGAHLDSILSSNPAGGLAPGADDDGSGCVVLLEAFRGLLESGFVPKRSIEFQWYAAEEVGLRGSQDIAVAYKQQNVNITAMLQFDVVGHYKGTKKVSVVTDFTNPALTEFLRLVIDGYLTFGWTWQNHVCGYGCSDHASFHNNGFPAGRLREVQVSGNWHTIRDTLEDVNFEQCLEYTRLAVGAIVELAEPYSL